MLTICKLLVCLLYLFIDGIAIAYFCINFFVESSLFSERILAWNF